MTKLIPYDLRPKSKMAWPPLRDVGNALGFTRACHFNREYLLLRLPHTVLLDSTVTYGIFGPYIETQWTLAIGAAWCVHNPERISDG